MSTKDTTAERLWLSEGIERLLFETRIQLLSYHEGDGLTHQNIRLENALKAIEQIHNSLLSLKYEKAAELTCETIQLLQCILLQTSSQPLKEPQIYFLISWLYTLQQLLSNEISAFCQQQSYTANSLTEFQSEHRQQLTCVYNLLFTHAVESIAPVNTLPLNDLGEAGFTELTRKLRQKYQLCLASVIRDVQPEHQLVTLCKLFAKLRALFQGTVISPLWDAALALGIGIQEGCLSLSNDVLDSLKALDNELRLISIKGLTRLDHQPDSDIFHTLLLLVNQCHTDNPQVIEVQARFGLEHQPEVITHDLTKLSPLIQLQRFLSQLHELLKPFSETVQTNHQPIYSLQAACKQLLTATCLYQHHLLEPIFHNISEQLDQLLAVHLKAPFDQLTSQAITNELLTLLQALEAGIMQKPTDLLRSLETKTEEIEEAVSTEKQHFFTDAQHILSSLNQSNQAIQHAPQNREVAKQLLKDLEQLNQWSISYDAEIMEALLVAMTDMIDAAVNGVIVITTDTLKLLNRCLALLPSMLQDVLSNNQMLTAEVLLCMEQADALKSGLPITDDEDLDIPELTNQEPAMLFGEPIVSTAPSAEQAPKSETPAPSISSDEIITPANQLTSSHNLDELIESSGDIANHQMQITHHNHDGAKALENIDHSLAQLKALMMPRIDTAGRRTAILEQLAQLTEQSLHLKATVEASEHLLTEQTAYLNTLIHQLTSARMLPLQIALAPLQKRCSERRVYFELPKEPLVLDKKVVAPLLDGLEILFESLLHQASLGTAQLTIEPNRNFVHLTIKFSKNLRETAQQLKPQVLTSANETLISIGSYFEWQFEDIAKPTLQIRLPKTMASFRALIIQDDHATYAIPMHSFSRKATIYRESLESAYHTDGKLIFEGVETEQLVYFGALTNHKTPELEETGYPVIFINQDFQHFALQLDKILEERWIATKTLGSQFDNIPEILGGTLLEDGRVVLILNPAHLYQQHRSFIPKMTRIPEKQSDSLLSELNIEL